MTCFDPNCCLNYSFFFHTITLHMCKLFSNAKTFPKRKLYSRKWSARKYDFWQGGDPPGGGVSRFLIFLTKGGGGVGQFLIFADKGRMGFCKSSFLADIIWEQPLIIVSINSYLMGQGKQGEQQPSQEAMNHLNALRATPQLWLFLKNSFEEEHIWINSVKVPTHFFLFCFLFFLW